VASYPQHDRNRAEGGDATPWGWVLLLPLLATLVPALYNRTDPQLFGIPFFYWYELAAIALGVGTTALVYRKTRR
jgi:hypothetical protein